MRTIVCVQARLGSIRFSRKVLADLNGKPVIQHVYERARQIPSVDRVVFTIPPEDRELRRLVRSWGTAIYPHRPPNVLAGYLLAARGERARVIVRITGDCPVLDPGVAGQVLDLFRVSPHCDFASNDTLVSGYPDGWDVEVFSRSALETAAAQATDSADREHVTSWMRRSLRCVTLMAPEPWAGPKKLSVDCEDDLRVVREWLAQQHG